MPEALSTHPVPYQHRWTPGGKESISTGWAYPPKDYERWAELVFQWVRHSVEQYGKAEVETWYWEVWNEPNILYWRGTPEEYHKLYDYAVDAVKRALPSARVGGPHVAGTKSPEATKFLRDFLEHCLRGKNYATGEVGSPLDFVAFHAKGEPRFVEGHVRTGIGAQLRDIDRGFEVVASYPELKGKPVIIGESDPDGCAACPSSVYPQNGYRNGTLYASYTAASFARKYALAERHGVNFEGAVTWAFEFEGQPYFAGFRVLSTNGIPLPVLNVFRMFGLMGGRRLAVESTGEVGLEAIRRDGVRGRPDVSALASLRGGKLCVLAWHHHDDDVPGPDASGRVVAQRAARRGRPRAAGALPHRPGPQQRLRGVEADGLAAASRRRSSMAELERASDLALLGSPEWVRPEGGKLTLRFTLPRQAVSLLVLDPGRRSESAPVARAIDRLRGVNRMVRQRRRQAVLWIALLAVVVRLGLGSRPFGPHLPGLVAAYAGDTLWATAAFLGVGIEPQPNRGGCRPRSRLTVCYVPGCDIPGRRTAEIFLILVRAEEATAAASLGGSPPSLFDVSSS